jgi:hypothetical protein
LSLAAVEYLFPFRQSQITFLIYLFFPSCRAVQITMWRSKALLPVAIESTAALLEALMMDE